MQQLVRKLQQTAPKFILQQNLKSQNFIKCAQINQINNNIYNWNYKLQQKYQFSTEKNNQKQEKQQDNEQEIPVKEQEQEQETQPMHDQRMNDFFEYLKSQVDNSENDTQLTEKQYTDPVVYQNTVEMKSKVSLNLAYAGFWFLASIATHQYVTFYHSIATVIPAWFFAGNMIQFQIGRQYIQKLGRKITLSENQERVDIELASGKTYTFDIVDIDLIDIIELNSHGGKSVKSGDKDSEIKQDNHFIAVFDGVDINKQEHKDLRILITDTIINIHNLGLLKEILSGEVLKVKQYEQVSVEVKEKIIQEEKQKEEDELERKLQEEINEIQRQKDQLKK